MFDVTVTDDFDEDDEIELDKAVETHPLHGKVPDGVLRKSIELARSLPKSEKPDEDQSDQSDR